MLIPPPIGWALLGLGVVVAIVAIILYRRKIPAWYSLRIIAFLLILTGVAAAFSITVGNRAGEWVRV
jgi:hypothetical protein